MVAGLTIEKVPVNTWVVFPCTGKMPEAFQDLYRKIYTEFFLTSKYQCCLHLQVAKKNGKVTGCHRLEQVVVSFFSAIYIRKLVKCTDDAGVRRGITYTMLCKSCMKEGDKEGPDGTHCCAEKMEGEEYGQENQGS